MLCYVLRSLTPRQKLDSVKRELVPPHIGNERLTQFGVVVCFFVCWFNQKPSDFERRR